jgi:SAM-dependent methyltransferase
MSFSNEWENRYKAKTHLSIWPWSDLVSLVMRHKPIKENFKVLELGCGAGANIPLFESLGVDYYAIEGSKTIVNQLHKQYSHFKNNIVCGDFTKDIPDLKFDLIVDRAALTHNNEKSIIECIDKCYNHLFYGGKFIGVDWFSTEYPDYKNGESVSDKADTWTRTNYIDGNFANVGMVHFSDKVHLLELFKNFKILSLTQKKLLETIPSENDGLSTWNFVAEKNE